MKTSTKQVFNFMNILSWIIFIGLCIKAGSLIFSFFVSIFINAGGARKLYLELNLSELYHFNIWHFSAIAGIIIFLAIMKAYIFYLVIKIFMKINFVHPFSIEVSDLISSISYAAFEIGIVSIIGVGYCSWLAKKGVTFPDLRDYQGTGGEFLFFAGVIFFIAQVFRKGIDIQAENDLTV